MDDRGRKTLDAQPSGDPFGDMNRAMSPSGTPDRDADIGFALGLVAREQQEQQILDSREGCLLYTSPSPRDVEESRMPSSA